MRTIWQSLAWKEWHEHKWKLVSMIAILWGITILPVVKLDRGTLIGIHIGLALGIAPLALFIGLGSAAGERSRGTLRFLQALPVPMWRVALHKFSFGLATVLVPAFATVGMIAAWTACLDLLGVEYRAVADLAEFQLSGRAPFAFLIHNWGLATIVLVTMVGTSSYVWTVAVAVNRKDEVSAGAVALAVIVGWWLCLTLAWKSLVAGGWIQGDESSALAIVGMAVSPGGLLPVIVNAGLNGVRYLTAGLVAALVAHGALATWFVARFARIDDLEVLSPTTATVDPARLNWLGWPARSPQTAILWKQFRVSGHLALLGLGIAAITVLLVVVLDEHLRALRLAEIYLPVAVSVGLALAIVMGIGTFLHDVNPRQNEFWRSRPIQPDQWFWIKFLTSLALLLAVIYGPVLLFALAGDVSRLRASSLLDLLMFPTIHVTLFTAAVTMTCLVRHAIYAAILSVAATYVGILIVTLMLVCARLVGLADRPTYSNWEISQGQVALGLALSLMICLPMAWMAVRHDWGQKSRY